MVIILGTTNCYITNEYVVLEYVLKKGNFMTIFQIIMIAMAAFFSFQVYQHIQALEDNSSSENSGFDSSALQEEADKAFLNGDLDRALMFLDQINIKGAKDSDVLAKMAYILVQKKRNNEALSYYQEALNIDQNNDMIQSGIASLYRKEKEYDKAQEHYKKALALDPNDPKHYYNYANLLVDLAQNSEALKMYEKAVELQPDFKEAQQEIEKLREMM